MNIYVYSDESGTFDCRHYKYYVFGGLIFFSSKEKEVCARKYSVAEKSIRNNYSKNIELKAHNISNVDKGKLYRSLNGSHKFGVVIEQQELMTQIFDNKKTKQRYLDFAYKIALKRVLEYYIKSGVVDPDKVDNIYVYNDEHLTATNGIYELREGLENELKNGTINFEKQVFYEPLFPNMGVVCLKNCDSKSNRLIRASDIIANRLYSLANRNLFDVLSTENPHVIILPYESRKKKIIEKHFSTSSLT